MAEVITPQQYLEFVADRLAAAGIYCGHGTDDTWDESAHLVLHALGLPADAAHEQLPDELSAAETEHINNLLQLRIDKRMPLPYLTNQAWFMHQPFYVDERVLIPRSPFASWIEQSFSPWITKPDAVKHILDIGTGSASLAICCAQVFSEAQVDAVDLSADALEVASKNIQHYNLSSRVSLHQGDCYQPLPAGRRYDFIISNPPYVDTDYWRQLPDEYQHEPEMALRADDQGLAVCANIMRQASEHLQEDGLLFVEVGYNQQTLQDAYPNMPFTWLDCDQGGEGIFMLTNKQLKDYYKAND